MHKHNVIFNKTVTKIVTILTKNFFFSISEPGKLPTLRKVETICNTQLKKAHKKVYNGVTFP